MVRERMDLPQLRGETLLADGGLETTLVFHDGMELPAFAAFVLVEDEAGRDRLRRYFDSYLAIARESGVGFLLETPTWRANADWGAKLGYSAEGLVDVNRRLAEMIAEIRDAHASPRPIVLSGCIGPRGDGYVPGKLMSADQATDYHTAQLRTFAETEVDMANALTLNYVDEAIGIVRAAEAVALPVAISFTVETDGRLAGGQPLGDAIEAVDAETGAGAAYYMINCAHPSHFESTLPADAAWTKRVLGLRANASSRSHAELDEATELDAGDPEELGGQYLALLGALPQLRVFGGCCGTDERHIRAIAGRCAA